MDYGVNEAEKNAIFGKKIAILSIEAAGVMVLYLYVLWADSPVRRTG